MVQQYRVCVIEKKSYTLQYNVHEVYNNFTSMDDVANNNDANTFGLNACIQSGFFVDEFVILIEICPDTKCHIKFCRYYSYSFGLRLTLLRQVRHIRVRQVPGTWWGSLTRSPHNAQHYTRVHRDNLHKPA